jgi:Flp pilus assembly protein TadB
MTLWVVCVLAFAGFLVVALAVLLYPSTAAQRAEKRNRLNEVSHYRVISAVGSGQGGGVLAPEAPTESAVSERALVLLDRALRARGQRDRVISMLERSGLRMRPEEWAAIVLAAIVVPAAVLAVVFHSALWVIPGAAIGVLGCWMFLRTKTRKRSAAFEAGLPDALQLVAGAMRAGFTLNQAIGSVAREGNEPIASEFGRALTEVRLGTELEDALDAMARRLKSYDLSLVVMAIRTAREVGGNLAEVLQTTAHTMRERSQLHRQVEVLSAEGRLSAKVLVSLPIFLAIYLLIFKQGYLNPLVDTGVGVCMLVAGVVLLAVGTFWISRIIKIEV